MNRAEPLAPHVGDHAETRKPHPCGSREWIVFRVGGDIGLRCAGCGHRVLMPRSVFNKSVKRVWQAPAAEGGTP